LIIFLRNFQYLAYDFIELGKDNTKLNLGLSNEEIKILNELSKDKSIVICKADKGNVTVVLNKKDYELKMTSILSDPLIFKELDNDPTIEREKALNSHIDYLKRINVIDNETSSLIRTSGSGAGIMYGLPKIHKEEVPLRPIISSFKSYNYKLAKWLDSLIKPLLNDNKFILKDSFDFVNRISKIDISNSLMVSFDIESLFTNVPLSETIDIICQLAYSKNDPNFV